MEQSIINGFRTISSLHNSRLFLSGNPQAANPQTIGLDSSVLHVETSNSSYQTTINAVIKGEDYALGVPSTSFPVDGDPVLFAQGLDSNSTNLNVYYDKTQGVHIVYLNGANPPLALAIDYPNGSDASNDSVVPNVIFRIADATDNKQKWYIREPPNFIDYLKI